MNILVLHGINLNMFGKRDPTHYGTITLAEIDARLQALAKELGVAVESFQTNSEGEMCARIHKAHDKADAVLVNAGAWTHYSYGIRDALSILTVPIVEVHMYPRPGGISPSLGPHRDREGADLRVRRRQLPARAACSGVGRADGQGRQGVNAAVRCRPQCVALCACVARNCRD